MKQNIFPFDFDKAKKDLGEAAQYCRLSIQRASGFYSSEIASLNGFVKPV
jgi:hypothetical protein